MRTSGPMTRPQRSKVSWAAGLGKGRCGTQPRTCPRNVGMRGTQFAEMSAFVAVAEHRNFTKAAAQLGISPPTLSQIIRSFEERLGVRLFNRTTRSVALTEAGERLLADALPVLDGMDKAMEAINSFRDK